MPDEDDIREEIAGQMQFGGLNTLLIAKSVDCMERENFNLLVSELIESFDARLAFTHASEIKLLSYVLYYMATFLSGEANTVGLSYGVLQAVTEQASGDKSSNISGSNNDNDNDGDGTAVTPSSSANRWLAAMLYGILPYLETKFSSISNFVVQDIGNLGRNASRIMRALDPLGPSWHPRDYTEIQKVDRLMSFGNDIIHWLFFGYGHYLDLPMRVSTLRVLHDRNRTGVPASISRVDKYSIILSRLIMLKIILNCIAGLQGFYAHTRELQKEAANEVDEENTESRIEGNDGDDNDKLLAASDEKSMYPFDRSCVICCERIKDPSVIPCGHIFCWECVQKLARTGPSNLVSIKNLKCPCCSQIYHVDMIRPLFFTTTTATSTCLDSTLDN